MAGASFHKILWFATSAGLSELGNAARPLHLEAAEIKAGTNFNSSTEQKKLEKASSLAQVAGKEKEQHATQTQPMPYNTINDRVGTEVTSEVTSEVKEDDEFVQAPPPLTQGGAGQGPEGYPEYGETDWPQWPHNKNEHALRDDNGERRHEGPHPEQAFAEVMTALESADVPMEDTENAAKKTLEKAGHWVSAPNRMSSKLEELREYTGNVSKYFKDQHAEVKNAVREKPQLVLENFEKSHKKVDKVPDTDGNSMVQVKNRVGICDCLDGSQGTAVNEACYQAGQLC